MTEQLPDREPYRFRLHWWGWVLIGVLLVTAAVVSLHVQGKHRLADVQAAITARGWPVDMVSLVASLPAVDHARQERAWNLLGAGFAWADGLSAPNVRQLQLHHLTEAEQVKFEAFVSAGAGVMGRIEALLDEGPLHLSSGGWIERDPMRLRAMTATDFGNLRTPNLLNQRAAMQWWALQAMTRDDPAPFLERMRQFNQACQQPTLLIDGMITIAISTIRDQTMLYLAAHGRLGSEALAAWSGEPAEQRAWLAGSFRGDRCLSQLPTAHGFNPLQSLEAAVLVSRLASIEARLLGQPDFPAERMPLGLPSIQVSIALPNLVSIADLPIRDAYSHRLRRLAGTIALSYRHGNALPTDHPEATARFGLSPFQQRHADEPAITYERLSTSRFRLGLDATHTPPTRFAPDAVPPAIAIGQPPSSKPALDQPWSIELDLDAILVPPPPPPGRQPKP